MNEIHGDSSPEQERQVLEALRPQYESRGYKFTIYPGREALPDFLGSYQPDAIAVRYDDRIAIEVRLRQTGPASRQLESVRKLFDGHPEWSFKVFYSGAPGPSVLLNRASAQELLQHASSVEALSQLGEYRAALVMAWALLEGALRAVEEGEASARPLTPGSVVQKLVMDGLLDQASGTRLRSLVELRNRTVHGDIAVQVSPADVATVLNAVRLVLREREAA